MKVECLPVGVFAANCYILRQNHEVVIIDPGASYRKIQAHLEQTAEDKVLAILLTHGHFDHIGAVDALVKRYQCPVYLSAADSYLAHTEKINRMEQQAAVLHCGTVDYPVDTLTLGSFQFHVYDTPGHTEGSVVLATNGCLFTGDTLFRGSCGRTDLYSGSDSKLYASLQLLSSLNPDLIIYPGHGESSTLGYELVTNPYLQ